jgi:glyoxylase-like metal-dependent hydrolase (beta-lactamase superfamily II)
MTTSKLQVEQVVVGPLESNCYIAWDDATNEGVIIDPGEDADRILNKVKELQVKIKHILATHGHFDHVAAVAPLKRALHAEFLAHEDDLFFIEDGKEAARRWGFSIEQPPKPDKFLKNGDIITVGHHQLQVLHTPGHSPGGVIFLHDRIVFGGDNLFLGSIGRTDFRQGSFEDLSKSIKTQLYTLPDDTIVYTGHGPHTTIGHEKQYNPFVRP